MRQRFGDLLGFAEIGNDHCRLERWKLIDDRAQLVADALHLAVVPIAVDREEHLGLDLPEAIKHAAFAEVGRA